MYDRKNEPQPELSVPSCPEWLKDEGRREWNRLVKELTDLGMLTQLERGAMAAYCQAWAEFRCAVEEGSFTTRDIAAKRLIRLAAELGLTPASRSRVQVQKKERNAKEGIAKYLG